MRVMLPTTDLVAPPAPAGYGFQGLILLGSKPNGRGIRTSFAVYTKSGARSGAKCDGKSGSRLPRERHRGAGYCGSAMMADPHSVCRPKRRTPRRCGPCGRRDFSYRKGGGLWTRQQMAGSTKGDSPFVPPTFPRHGRTNPS